MGGGQCAVAPSPPSVICNDYQQCGCSVQLSSSHPPGDLLAAGTHAFQFEATNDNGFSRTCSYDVIVDNQCNPNGPSLNCPEGDIFIGTDFQCSRPLDDLVLTFPVKENTLPVLILKVATARFTLALAAQTMDK